MTRDEALSLADKILSLINSRPRTPSRDEIADAIMAEAGAADGSVSEPAAALTRPRDDIIAEAYRKLAEQANEKLRRVCIYPIAGASHDQ
jgi:hypothetical protein